MLSVIDDPLRGVLEATAQDFAGALRGHKDGPHGNRFSVGTGELAADQLREIAAPAADDESWTERQGRQTLRTDTMLSRLTLGKVVGAERFLSAGDFVLTLARIVHPLSVRRGPIEIAQVVNLVVTEPSHEPENELPIWVTVAYKLASGKERDFFAQEIPGLRTDHDAFFSEIPPDARFGERLRPDDRELAAPTMSLYKARLLALVMQETAENALSTDEQRNAAFEARRPELEAYVDTHVLSKVNAALLD